jgi:hypothetical protein
MKEYLLLILDSNNIVMLVVIKWTTVETDYLTCSVSIYLEPINSEVVPQPADASCQNDVEKPVFDNNTGHESAFHAIACSIVDDILRNITGVKVSCHP